MTVDRSGALVVAWQESVGALLGAVVAREVGGGFELRSPSAGTPGFHGDLKLAAAGDGALLVAWQHHDGESDLRAKVWLESGEVIAPNGHERFSFAPYGYQHEVAAGDEGEMLLVWNQGLDGGARRGVCVARRLPGELDFARPAGPYDVLSARLFFSNEPEIVRNARGDALVTWFESTGGKLATFASERWGFDGSFSHPGAEHFLSPTEGDVDAPEPAIAEDGSAAVVWRQARPDVTMATYLATRTASGQWTTPANIDDPFSVPADFVWNTRIAFTPTGDLYVAWEEKRGDDLAIRLAHRDSSGRWLAAGTAPLRLSREGFRAIDPVLAVGRDGGVVAAWREEIDGVWRAMARRSSAHFRADTTATTALSNDEAGGSEETEALAESLLWDARTTLSEANAGDASGVKVAIGGDGERVVVAWGQAGRIRLATVD
ncbi:MAG: hypothetical protein EXR75_12825 [Myxococcales bacterium]|nr:hypothetical protein [Myxococcales bacterium]